MKWSGLDQAPKERTNPVSFSDSSSLSSIPGITSIT